VATVVEVAARVAEIMRVGAERTEVTAEEVIRELKKLGFSCIGNVVDWHNETVETESEDGKETKTVLVPRVTIIAKADLEKGALDAIAEVLMPAQSLFRLSAKPQRCYTAPHEGRRNRRSCCQAIAGSTRPLPPLVYRIRGGPRQSR